MITCTDITRDRWKRQWITRPTTFAANTSLSAFNFAYLITFSLCRERGSETASVLHMFSFDILRLILHYASGVMPGEIPKYLQLVSTNICTALALHPHDGTLWYGAHHLCFVFSAQGEFMETVLNVPSNGNCTGIQFVGDHVVFAWSKRIIAYHPSNLAIQHQSPVKMEPLGLAMSRNNVLFSSDLSSHRIAKFDHKLQFLHWFNGSTRFFAPGYLAARGNELWVVNNGMSRTEIQAFCLVLLHGSMLVVTDFRHGNQSGSTIVSCLQAGWTPNLWSMHCRIRFQRQCDPLRAIRQCHTDSQ